MSQEPLRVEFRVELGNRRPVPKPVPGPNWSGSGRTGQPGRTRNLALAYWIDALIRGGGVADLATVATVATMCGVSRARVSNVVSLIGAAAPEQERWADIARLNR